MKTIELFSGIGGFRLAADEHGLTTIWANDIDPKACAVYRNKFGNAEIKEGDISSLKAEIPNHDLLTGGFPCQPFSSAGKKQGIEDPRGTLFQNIVDILHLHKPKYFILENVKRLISMHSGMHFATILDALIDAGYIVEWRILNAMDFGLPQNRQRVFIIGEKEGVSKRISTPKLVETKSLDSKTLSKLKIFSENEYAKNITEHGIKFKEWGIARKGKFLDAKPLKDTARSESPKLSAIIEDDAPAFFDFTDDTKSRLEKSVYVNKYYNGVQLLWNQSGGARMGYTVFGTEGVAPTLTASTSRHYERYFINGKFRRLTNVEYARIQGFPDDHCDCASIYDQYALYGNAVPPNMVSWVLNQIGKSYSENHTITQEDLFATA